MTQPLRILAAILLPAVLAAPIVLAALVGCQQSPEPAAQAARAEQQPLENQDPVTTDESPVDSAQPTTASDNSADDNGPASPPVAAEGKNIQADAPSATKVDATDPAEIPAPTLVATADNSAKPPPSSGAKTPPKRNSPTDKNKIVDKSFDDIKFPMEKTERFRRKMLTPQIESLEGQRIRIRGYILPTSFQTGLTAFVLVRDNMECCFGPGAALFDCVLVEMDPGKTANFSIRPVAVEGRFSIREFPGPDGNLLAIYHLQAGKVE